MDGGRLPPAHEFQDGNNDVAGAAGQAADDPVASVGLGGAGKLPAAVDAMVGHRE